MADLTPPPGLQEWLASQQPAPAAAPEPLPTDINGPAHATPDRRAADLTATLEAPDPAKAFAATPAQPGTGGPPDPAAVFAQGPATQTETTTSSTTSGMSAADAAAQRGLIGEARGAQEKANASEGEQRRLQVQADEAENTRLLHEAAQQQKALAAKQAVVDLQEAEVKNKLQAASDWRPDRSELFSGSTGAARGILAAVAVMAGGWMQGRGMTRDNQFMGAIERMIDDNVNDQVRKNSATIQFLKDQKGDVQAAAAELKKRQMEYATQKVNARAALSKIPAAQAGVQTFNDAAAARTAEWQAEQEKALRRTVSNTISKHTEPVKVGRPEERTPAQAAAQSATAAVDDFGTKAGLIRDANGKFTVGEGALPPGAVEGVKGFFGAATPIRDALEAAKESFGRLQSQGVISKDEEQRFGKMLGEDTLTRAQLASKLNALEVIMQAKLRSNDAAQHRADTTVPSTWRPLGTR